MSQMQTALAATSSSAPSQVRAAIKPPQSPRLASLREWQARQFLRRNRHSKHLKPQLDLERSHVGAMTGGQRFQLWPWPMHQA